MNYYILTYSIQLSFIIFCLFKSFTFITKDVNEESKEEHYKLLVIFTLIFSYVEGTLLYYNINPYLFIFSLTVWYYALVLFFHHLELSQHRHDIIKSKLKRRENELKLIRTNQDSLQVA